MSGAFILI